MIMRNTVAQIAFRINGNYLGRFAVAAVFLLSFFVSGAWGACTPFSGGSTTCKNCIYNNFGYMCVT